MSSSARRTSGDRLSTVWFAENVGPSSTSTLEYTVEAPATVEDVDVRIYNGPETDLEITPSVEREEGDRVPLVELVGKNHVDGDDDKFEFGVSEGVTEGEKIAIEATNNDGSNDYDFSVDIALDRFAGTARFAGYSGGCSDNGAPPVHATD